jgi:uncharacterized membrane protein
MPSRWRASRGPRSSHGSERDHTGLYTLLSIAGVVLMAIGFGRYRAAGYIPVWDPPVWTRHLSLILVWPAFIMFVAAYFPGRIKGTLKHPMLAGVKLWAAAHLLANGDLGSILLFGSILAWAVAARVSAKRRDEVKDHGGPTTFPAGPRNDLVAIAIGTVVWLAFLFRLHTWLIGVAVLPRVG